MPLFDFQCRSCQQVFEVLIRTSETPVCPHCGSDQLDRQVGLVAVHGRTKAMLNQARSQAAREGHFSHYRLSERPVRPG